MAFVLGARPRPRSPERDIFWLRREDIEAVAGADAPSGEDLKVADWLDDRRPLLDRARKAVRPFPSWLLDMSTVTPSVPRRKVWTKSGETVNA
jgi:hypothetical protein